MKLHEQPIGVEEVLADLIERDRLDAETGKKVHQELLGAGFHLAPEVPVLVIDSGVYDSIEGRVEMVREYIKEKGLDCRFISIEGESGTGKSSTAKALAKSLPGIMFSMGELYRYVTYQTLRHPELSSEEILQGVNLVQVGPNEVLEDPEFTSTEELHALLHTHEIDLKTPVVAADKHVPVIRYLSQKLDNVKTPAGCPVIIEGRDYNLVFLPADLRVKLVADPKIRAERRYQQFYNK